ncbi:MAG TPA: HepT-like ribonuclease domain-containing protein [Solirubrobacterales bacterium]
MRDKLIHDYFGVDLDLIWDVVAVELPAARTRIVALLDELDTDSGSDLPSWQTEGPRP